MMFNKLPDWIDHLHTFGEIAIVHDGDHAKVRAKLQDKGDKLHNKSNSDNGIDAEVLSTIKQTQQENKRSA
jgi:hypothetical protein